MCGKSKCHEEMGRRGRTNSVIGMIKGNIGLDVRSKSVKPSCDRPIRLVVHSGDRNA